MLKRKGTYVNAFLMDKKTNFFEKVKAWALLKDKKAIGSILGSKASPELNEGFHHLVLVCVNEWNTSYRLSKKKEVTIFGTLFDSLVKNSIKIPSKLAPLKSSNPPPAATNSKPNQSSHMNTPGLGKEPQPDEVFKEFGK